MDSRLYSLYMKSIITIDYALLTKITFNTIDVSLKKFLFFKRLQRTRGQSNLLKLILFLISLLIIILKRYYNN